MRTQLEVRELLSPDIMPLVDYWMDSSPDFLVSIGVDLSRMPSRQQFEELLKRQLKQSYREKISYCLIGLLDGRAIGHCNINPIHFGKEAYMHLHIWKESDRKRGWGSQLVRKSLHFFFSNFELKHLYCEPYALNAAPNQLLQKMGFQFIKKYMTIPGSINFEQEVNRWEMSAAGFAGIA